MALGASLLLANSHLNASNHLPALAGRVVDNAGMIDQARERHLSGLLQGHEEATTNQIVVVTLSDLDGVAIESYGYQLGRHWGIGQAGKDNGVLLIVAKKERKVRIEVGYGLEGVLTDAISSNIINSIIVPEFKKAQFGSGIEQGTVAIIEALGGQYKMKRRNGGGANRNSAFSFFPFVVVFMIFLAFYRNLNNSTGGWSGYSTSGSRISRGGGSFGGGGGFSGGGGGFGGGGASGGW